jgi:hypothetical protein
MAHGNVLSVCKNLPKWRWSQEDFAKFGYELYAMKILKHASMFLATLTLNFV